MRREFSARSGVRLTALLVLASRQGLIDVISRCHLKPADALKLLLAIVVVALGFAILLTG